MRTGMRWIVAVVAVLHGLIHLLGAAKGLGWADVTQLEIPISTAMGVAWLAAAVLVVVSGALLSVPVRWWWVVGAVAAVVSQGVILTAWSDAKAGTVANVILLAAAVYGYASQGPRSYRAEYRRRVAAVLTEPLHRGVVGESDLAHLPEPVATFVRRSGALGKPRVTNFHARIHGRIRAGTNKAWMSFTGEQAFNNDNDLVDFVSDDRQRVSLDGKTLTPLRWSTPVREYRMLDSRQVSVKGEARWDAPDPEGEFAYLEFNLDAITYNTENQLKEQP